MGLIRQIGRIGPKLRRLISPIFCSLLTALALHAAPADGKIHIAYWEKWSGEEELAMHEVVDDFNHSQNRIVVDFLSVGQIEQKTLLATAGGDPPDISGVYLADVYAFVDRNALTPLDDFMHADSSTPEQFNSRYARGFANLGDYEDHTWGVPSTPTTAALYWNKDLFRAAGLDPERPPRTLAEFDAMSDKLTLHDSAGRLTQVGFLPQQNNGWIWAFPQWFGGQIFDGKNITVGTDPAVLKTYQWLGGYSTRYGMENIRRLSSSFGAGLSPQDPFMTGRMALIFDGVWRYSYIRQFAPGLNIGVANWPEAVSGISDFTIADSDMLVIPRGAKHPREAWEFIRYVSSPNLSAQKLEELSGVEKLCYIQEKASPLRQWSPFFATHHPNPFIATFRQLAESSHAVSVPKLGIVLEFQRSLGLAFDRVRLGLATPEQALAYCQQRTEDSWQWHKQSLARRRENSALTTNAPTATK